MLDTTDKARLADKTFVLATDLDGTFLGGTDAQRRALYDWIEDHRDTVGLIFVTGRDPEFIMDLCGSGTAPWPDYAVGDVGTTIARSNANRGSIRWPISKSRSPGSGPMPGPPCAPP